MVRPTMCPTSPECGGGAGGGEAVGASLPCGPPESLLIQPTGPAQGGPEKWG